MRADGEMISDLPFPAAGAAISRHPVPRSLHHCSHYFPIFMLSRASLPDDDMSRRAEISSNNAALTVSVH